MKLMRVQFFHETADKSVYPVTSYMNLNTSSNIKLLVGRQTHWCVPVPKASNQTIESIQSMRTSRIMYNEQCIVVFDLNFIAVCVFGDWSGLYFVYYIT